MIKVSGHLQRRAAPKEVAASKEVAAPKEEKILRPLREEKILRPLSRAEHAVLIGLMTGASNREISKKLEVAEAAIKAHTKAINRKFKTTNRTQAAMLGFKLIKNGGIPVEQNREEEMKRYWMGEVGKLDDFGHEITNVFYDGKTRMGPWAIMNEASWADHGVGRTGTGYAQKYAKQPYGKWLKIEG